MIKVKKKLRTWLEANKLAGGAKLFLISHQGRALILLYLSIYSSWKIVRFFTSRRLRSEYHIECSCKDIGDFLMLPHPRNIIISAASIGDYVQINQNVTIGGNMKKTVEREFGIQKLPIINSHVVVYTNAVVGGPVIIGDHVIIGANCVCTHDIAPHTLVYQKQYVSSRPIEVDSGSYHIIKP